ncbi:hypothetical protein PI124_g19379 [Phytophthora idaei]|nr:hypothetical protein PI125_g24707 [Phytophthora idaei]KAG3064764.1 hypothetical protein PI125_g24128 [Phytophthora idaei]KAG3124937.1 hypothetical protein PI126_g23005 [Phytophthora idaei]KAG3232676.1 hypothetical protein PI124_g22241 [Phytophthora idaei]KAG3235590.1 hypothetical protein PI124_g19379 [Phytophthora idaei]
MDEGGEDTGVTRLLDTDCDRDLGRPADDLQTTSWEAEIGSATASEDLCDANFDLIGNEQMTGTLDESPDASFASKLSVCATLGDQAWD